MFKWMRTIGVPGRWLATPLTVAIVLIIMVMGLACDSAPIPATATATLDNAPATVTPNGAVSTATATPDRDATASTATPSATATPDSATATAIPAGTPGPVSFADPPGDCWGGALSADPVQCHALEEIQRDDLIEVEGMYEGGGALLVYFLLASNLTTYDQLHQALKKKSRRLCGQEPEPGQLRTGNVSSVVRPGGF